MQSMWGGVIPDNELAVKISARVSGEIKPRQGTTRAELLCLDCVEKYLPWVFDKPTKDAPLSPAPCLGCGRPLALIGYGLIKLFPGMNPPIYTNRLVCSNRCRVKYNRGSNLPDRNCQHCGKPFTPKRKDAKFCSVKCRVANHRAG